MSCCVALLAMVVAIMLLDGVVEIMGVSTVTCDGNAVLVAMRHNHRSFTLITDAPLNPVDNTPVSCEQRKKMAIESMRDYMVPQPGDPVGFELCTAQMLALDALPYVGAFGEVRQFMLERMIALDHVAVPPSVSEKQKQHGSNTCVRRDYVRRRIDDKDLALDWLQAFTPQCVSWCSRLVEHMEHKMIAEAGGYADKYHDMLVDEVKYADDTATEYLLALIQRTQNTRRRE